ncbi:hypothetical protein C8A05DRAFT_19145 [Staphylotrichum tortipilum]|uniref:Uncharacterized protein n=1 Tax=Staphylotrichum tortipilum TaxID=2831512 RepID=A0AAN6MDC6_9PEZI|nr:hypothetical protein C8A05DRAFT_19145 [Staphylotrichum longicolle]
MAHQASNIPWNVLASNLHWSELKHPGHGDLHLRFKPDQGKKLHYFVEAFIRNIREHSYTARKQYPEHYNPPLPEEVILDDAVVCKITPTVRRWRAQRKHPGFCRCGSGILRSEETEHKCECPIPIPPEERTAAAFYRRYEPNRCYMFFETNGKAFYNLEIVKTLLLYGEMDTIFRVCAYPGVDLRTWWSMYQCYCENPDAGWDSLCRTALLPYIALNVISCFPETWDSASGKTNEKDYRRMRIYQYMLKHCTKSGMTTEVATHPHRQFFGIADGQFKRYGTEFRGPGLHIPYPYGLMPLEAFLNWDQVVESKPAPADIPQVQWILHSKGLPMELVLEIMAFAGYAPRGRLQVPHDPFHPENREELAKYLRFCWEVLVRCDMMAVALGMAIPWRDLVSNTLVQLLSCVPRRWYTIPDDVDHPESYVFL